MIKIKQIVKIITINTKLLIIRNKWNKKKKIRWKKRKRDKKNEKNEKIFREFMLHL